MKKKPTLSDVVDRLDKIEVILNAQEIEEEEVEHVQTKELSEMQKLEDLESEIKRDVMPHPLTRITYHDVTKGLIGAFFGVVGHFAFFYSHKVAETLSTQRATVILLVSLVLLVIFLYFSGFRRVEEYRKYLPARVAIIYFTAMSVAIAVLFLFGVLTWPMDAHELYVNVAAVSILAVMGAATADLLGGE